MLSPVRNAMYCYHRPQRKRVIARKNNQRASIEVTVCNVHKYTALYMETLMYILYVNILDSDSKNYGSRKSGGG